MITAGEGRGPGDGREVGRRVQQAYATRVDIDTAAQHLWSVDREARRLRGRRRRQRLVSAAASLLLLISAAGTVAGSAAALPGETLYSVKAGLERAELTVAFSDAANARAHLRHSRVRLDELEQAAESDPQVVPEIAERFFTSLDRAAALGGDALAAEVAALRSSASLLMDRLARELDPSIAKSLSVARVTQDPTSSSEGRQALPAGGASVDRGAGPGGEPGDAEPTGVEPATGGGDTGGAGGDPGGAAEPVETQPETSVAEADEDEADEPAGPVDELVEESTTAEVPPESTVADPEETAPSEAESSSADDEEGGDSAGPDDEHDDGSVETSSQETSTAGAGATAEDGDGVDD